jgi:beta-1,4-mannooligosaccharide phosphorylase
VRFDLALHRGAPWALCMGLMLISFYHPSPLPPDQAALSRLGSAFGTQNWQPGGQELRHCDRRQWLLVLSEELPQVIRFRSREPVLIQELPQERQGIVANVAFPTGIDRRDDLGSPDRFDVYYGMADNRIGVARLDVPKHLPPDGPKDLPQATL